MIQVAKYTFLNLFIFLNDPKPWPDNQKMTAPAKRDEVVSALQHWSPAIRELVDLLPEDLTKWAIFDMADNPATTYARGRVCLAGDAAHASRSVNEDHAYILTPSEFGVPKIFSR